MLLNKDILNKLFYCNLSDETSQKKCKYASIIMKYLIMINGDKITSTNQLPIFFTHDENDKKNVNLHPYVINFYRNLGITNREYIEKEKSIRYKINYNTVLAYNESKYIDPTYLKNNIYYLMNINNENLSLEKFKNIFNQIIQYFIDNKNSSGKYYKNPPFFINKKSIKEIKDKKNINSSIINNLLEILVLYEYKKPTTVFNTIQETFYLLEKEMLGEFIITIILGSESNKYDIEEKYSYLYQNYIKKHEMYKKILKHFDKSYFDYDVVEIKFNEDGKYTEPSIFMETFVPLIDKSIYNKAYYYDSNNKITEANNPTNHILRDAYLSGYKSYVK